MGFLFGDSKAPAKTQEQIDQDRRVASQTRFEEAGKKKVFARSKYAGKRGLGTSKGILDDETSNKLGITYIT